MNTRISTFYKLSSHFALVDDAQLDMLLSESAKTTGWGKNCTVTVGQSKIFIKRIPVTALEYRNMFSTRNRYNLPTYYNYGIWSAGFGAFRELTTHIKTTNWVLSGAIDNFPLMYHYRLRPFTGQRPDVNMEEHQEYVDYWNSNQEISRYILARAGAEYEAVLFLEHLPYTLESWLGGNIDKLSMIIAEMRKTITFLRKHGVIHFDVHNDNIMTDGSRPYLTDFGLALDRQFNLSEIERTFFAQHTHYDYGEFIYGLAWYLFDLFQALPPHQQKSIRRTYGLQVGMPYSEMLPILLDNIEALYVDNSFPIDEYYVDIMVKYRPITMLMHTFATEMRSTNTKSTKFTNTELKRLLKETKFLAIEQP